MTYLYILYPDRKNLYRLSDKLTSLGIIWGPDWGRPSIRCCCDVVGGVSGDVLNWARPEDVNWARREDVNWVRLIAVVIPVGMRWEKFCNINDAFKRVIWILVMRHISTGILTRIAQVILVKIGVEMFQFNRIPMTLLNVSFMLQTDW